MKLVGFLMGAAVAGVGVFAFNTWRHVSDADRLAAVLLDHCIPYVQTGDTPFTDIGRTVGVYDGIDRLPDIENGGIRLIYDARFVAQWGESGDADGPARVCIINDTYARSDSKGFEVAPASLTGWVASKIAPQTGLNGRQTDLTPPPRVMSWGQDGTDENSGLRLFLTAQMFGVSDVIVVSDMPDL